VNALQGAISAVLNHRYSAEAVRVKGLTEHWMRANSGAGVPTPES